MDRKWCGACSQWLFIEAFHKRKKASDGLQTICKTCRHKEYKERYRTKPEAYKEATKRYQVRILNWFLAYRAGLSCSECPEAHPGCLDFHHLSRDEKSDEIANMVRHGKSIARIQKEIAKCLVLCANCHRKKHWKERNCDLVGVVTTN